MIKLNDNRVLWLEQLVAISFVHIMGWATLPVGQ